MTARPPEPVADSSALPLKADAAAAPPGVARALLRLPRTRIALAVLVIVVLAALLAPWLSPHDPRALRMDASLLPPRSPGHPLGTDQAGRDLLSRLLDGARVSLGVASLSVALSTLVGTSVGALAGYVGGALDTVLMRFVDALLSVPRVLLLIAVSGLWGRLELPALVLLLGLTGWMGVARLVRAEARTLARREHVLAVRALGAGEARVLLRHVLPGCLAPAVVAATLGVAHVVALEAGLSYLNLGVAPPRASWGTLIEEGTSLMPSGWWLSVFPGLAIVVVMLACTALGDALRDALDPRELSRR